MFPEEKADIVLDQNAEVQTDLMSQSMYGNLMGQNVKHVGGPFSAKRVIHESDTPHAKSQQGKHL